MTLRAGCPRCAAPVTQDGVHEAGWTCRDHGRITPLWRPSTADYEAFADHVVRAAGVPSYLPWPLSPGWMVTDFGSVGELGAASRAAFVTTTGPSDLDGVVELTVVTEEPGVGLGARVAGLVRSEPGSEVGEGAPHARVRVDGRPVKLWSLLTSDVDVAFDRSVFAGEAGGRWLWVVLRPASAALMLTDEWVLVDVTDLGPELLELPFGESPPAW